VTDTEVTLEAPPGAKLLVVTLPGHATAEGFLAAKEALKGIRAAIHKADLENDWPVVITVAAGVDVR
jgi:hypothetical protein